MGFLSSEEVLEGRFRLQQYVGAGGLGEVVTAWDELEERKVAVKFQHSRGLEGSLTYQLSGDGIHAEAATGKLLSGIEHIPPILHCSPEGAARAYFVMEYVEGKTLAQFIVENRPVGERVAAAVIGQLCEILAAVHDCGYIHRDVKPENIVIATSGEVWLLDVGAATEIGRRADDKGGTPGYAAPEQYDLVNVLTARADIFGLGCVLLEMCMPCGPYSEVAGKPEPGCAPYPDRIPIVMQDRLRDLAFEMIAIAESDRPASVRDVHERLYQSLPLKGSAPPAKLTNPDPTGWYRRGANTLF